MAGWTGRNCALRTSYARAGWAHSVPGRAVCGTTTQVLWNAQVPAATDTVSRHVQVFRASSKHSCDVFKQTRGTKQTTLALSLYILSSAS